MIEPQKATQFRMVSSRNTHSEMLAVSLCLLAMPKTISLYEFGGLEVTIRDIQKPFVEFFKGCAPVLDIGCGRGVFLELLAAAGIQCLGIDHSEEALAACRQKGLTVSQAEARGYLRQSA